MGYFFSLSRLFLPRIICVVCCLSYLPPSVLMRNQIKRMQRMFRFLHFLCLVVRFLSYSYMHTSAAIEVFLIFFSESFFYFLKILLASEIPVLLFLYETVLRCNAPISVCPRGCGHTLGIRQPKQSLPSGIRQTTLAQWWDLRCIS